MIYLKRFNESFEQEKKFLVTDRFKKNSNITALTLEKLCLILDCQPNDVITFVQK